MKQSRNTNAVFIQPIPATRRFELLFEAVLGMLISICLAALPKIFADSLPIYIWPVAALLPLALYFIGRRIGFYNTLAFSLIAICIYTAISYREIFCGMLYLYNTALAAEPGFIPLTVSGILPEAGQLLPISILVTACISIISAFSVGAHSPYPLMIIAAAVNGILLFIGFELRIWVFAVFVLLLLILILRPHTMQKRRRIALPAVGIIAAAAIFAIILPALQNTGFIADISAKNAAVLQSIKDDLEKWRYETDISYTPLPEGKLAAANSVSYTGNIVMSLSMQNPEVSYIRTFTGHQYADNTWSDAGELNALHKPLYLSLAQKGFYPAIQLSLYTSMAYDTQYSLVKVDNHALSSRYIYTPHNAALTADLTAESVHFEDDSHISISLLTPPRSYSFITATPRVKSLLMSETLSSVTANITDEEQFARFNEAENLYRSFVYNQYLTISSEEKELLKGLFSEETIADLHTYSHRKIISLLQKYYTDNYSYSNDEPLPEAGYDVLSNFINTKRGYDVHFATLTTLLFRMAGIPARYAEGYHLSESDVSMYTEVHNITFEIPDSYAHAWCEIYVDKLGWLPVETTPGFFTLNYDTAQDDGIDDVLKDDPSYFYQKEQEVTPETPEEPPEEEPITEDNNWQLYLMIAGGILLFIFLMLLPMLIRRMRHARFDKGNNNKRALCLYKALAQLLKYSGKGELGIYLTDNLHIISAACLTADDADIQNFLLDAYGARFGSKKEADIEKMKSVFFNIRYEIQKQSKLPRRVALYFLAQ